MIYFLYTMRYGKSTIRFIAAIVLLFSRIDGSPDHSDTTKILVLPFQSTALDTGSGGLGAALAEMLMYTCVAVELPVVYDASFYDSAVAPLKPWERRIDEKGCLRLWNDHDISLAVHGRTVISRAYCHILVTAYHTESSIPLATYEKLVIRQAGEIHSALSECATMLAAVIGLEIDERMRGRAAAAASTGDLEAASAFGRAWVSACAQGITPSNSTAMHFITRAIELDPGYCAAWHLRSRLMHAMGEEEGAINDLLAAKRIDARYVAFLEAGTMKPDAAVDTADQEESLQVITGDPDREDEGLTEETVQAGQVGRSDVFSLPGDSVPGISSDQDSLVKRFLGNGTLKSQPQENTGVWNGTAEHFFDNGILQAAVPYTRGVIDGTVRLYFPDGTPLAVMDFKEGKRHGESRIFGETGEISSTMRFLNGSPEGPATLHYPDGAIRRKAKYAHGLLEGVSRFYFEDGTPRAQISYHNDLPHGISMLYFSNGGKKAEIRYENGLKHGVCRFLYPSGTVWKEYPYVNDRLEGTVVSYYENRAVYQEEPFHAGRLHGRMRMYYPDGTLKQVTRYKNGTRTGTQRRYYANGALKEEVPFAGSWWKKTTVTGWYPDGKRRIIARFKNGRRHGSLEWFHANGERAARAKHKNGVRVRLRRYNEKGEKVLDKKYKKTDEW